MNDRLHTLTGAYALNALDDPERRQFEAHQSECPDCAFEVDELRATCVKLGMAALRTPPEALRHAVMTQVRVIRQDSPTTHPAPPARPVTGMMSGGWQGRSRDRATALAAALGAAAALVLGIVDVRASQQHSTVQAELNDLQTRYTSLTEVAAAPDARGVSAPVVGGGTAFVLASHDLDQAVLVLSGLPAPASGHAYQTWLIGHSHLRSAGVSTIGESGHTEPLRIRDLDGAAKVAVTIEPLGGSSQPTTKPVVLFDLPA